MVCTVWGQSNVWDGKTKEDLTDKGDDVYHISTAAQLAKLAELVNAGDNFADKTVILQNDIVLNVGVLDEGGNLQNSGAGLNLWKPIGKNNENSFKGTFNGNGKTVSGVYIDDNNQSVRLGLFGYLGSGGEIKNVGVEDSYVKGTGNYADVGGVCGYSNGGSISNSYNAGLVEGTGNLSSVGGVCGYSGGGTIFNSYNAGSVKGETYVGGVCGYSYDGTISNSYNAGSVEGTEWNAKVGGVCGYSFGSLSNSYNAGSVEGGESASVGGVCGYSEDDGPITDCFYLAGTAKKGVGGGRWK